MASLPQASIWLLPSNPSLLSSTVSALSKEFGVPSFSPHVTLHCTYQPVEVEQLKAAVKSAAAKHPKVERLTVSSIGHSSVRFKTLFLEFEYSETLHAFAGRVATALPSEYEFVPHLSLMYHEDLSEEARVKLQAKYSSAFVGMELQFHEIALVSPGSGRSDFGDVEAWEVLSVFKLGET